jgi:hypothetical protein
MNQSRSKKIRFAMSAIYTKFKDSIDRACNDKLKQPNRLGGQQHIRINAKRQTKKMVTREGLA